MFVTEGAIAGAHMLSMSGSRLQQMLLEYGLSTEIRGPDDVERVCTGTRRVRHTFADLCYVIISQSVDLYPNCRYGPVCTCKWCCWYATCDLILFARFLPLRLQGAELLLKPETRGKVHEQGREKGSTKTNPKPKRNNRTVVCSAVRGKESPPSQTRSSTGFR